MKNLTKIVSGILAIGILVATGVTALAASDIAADTTTNQSNTTISERFSNKGLMKMGKHGFGNKERPELTDEQKATMAENMKERLAEQLKDGKITQEQYDGILSDIVEGKKPMFLGMGGGKGRGNHGPCNIENQK